MAAADFLLDIRWLPLVDAIAKATLLFAAAGVTCAILRRASAAARHLVWTLALTAALLLPVLSIALPRWQMPLVTLESNAAAPPARDRTSEAPGESLTSEAPALPRRTKAERSASDTALTSGASNIAVPSAGTSAGRPLTTDIFAIWAIGTAAILLRLAIGIVAVLWMSRRTELVTDAPWLPLARSLVRELGVTPRVRFLRSRRATMPMAVGIVRPAVLMPAEADEWPAERLRIVLLHELAHVKRRDCLTHVVAQVACAFYWFNPLVWIAARHLRTERERACDDLVLAAGTCGPDYADQLLEIARVMRAERFPAVLASASLAMAHRSQLEGRLIAILDPTVRRAGITPLRTSLTTLAAAIALVPLASMQPWAHASEPVERAAMAPAVSQNPAPATPTPTPTPTPVAPAPAPVPSRPHVDRQNEAVTQAIVDAVRDSVSTSVEQSVEQSVVDSVSQSVRASAPMAAEFPVVEWPAVEALQEARPKIAEKETQTARKVDPRTIAALTAALKDVDKDVRATALHALVKLRDPSIYEPLIQALSDASAEMREHAAAGLGQLRDRRAVEPLIAALKDQSGDVREQVVFALGQLRDRTAIPALTAALKDTDPDVREQAAFALGQFRDPATFDGLAAALRDDRAGVREQAVFALGQLRDRRAIEPLISALKDAAPSVREQAAFALGQIRDKGAVEALIFALKDTSADVREQAAFALGQLRDPRAIDALTEALKDASASVRQQAAFALGQLIR